jgi:hypothetical protein
MTFVRTTPPSKAFRGAAAALLIAVAGGCADAHRATGILEPATPTAYAGYPGFDIGVYPGDATLAAWRFPTSPYHWVGYYLAAPCHRDVSWMEQYKKVTDLGWGTAMIYVGQQDWSQIPDLIPLSRRDVASPTLDRIGDPSLSTAVTCSTSLLSADQGAAEAADAVAKTASEGVPAGSAIFLDVEYVRTVSQPLVTYMSAWIAGVLADGRYRPAIYCAKSNAAAIYSAAAQAYAAAGRHDAATFWIAASAGFAITRAPTDVGLAYASVWQGLFDVSQAWGGAAATIDVDVASTPSPSAP